MCVATSRQPPVAFFHFFPSFGCSRVFFFAILKRRQRTTQMAFTPVHREPESETGPAMGMRVKRRTEKVKSKSFFLRAFYSSAFAIRYVSHVCLGSKTLYGVRKYGSRRAKQVQEVSLGFGGSPVQWTMNTMILIAVRECLPDGDTAT